MKAWLCPVGLKRLGFRAQTWNKPAQVEKSLSHQTCHECVGQMFSRRSTS